MNGFLDCDCITSRVNMLWDFFIVHMHILILILNSDYIRSMNKSLEHYCSISEDNFQFSFCFSLLFDCFLTQLSSWLHCWFGVWQLIDALFQYIHCVPTLLLVLILQVIHFWHSLHYIVDILVPILLQNKLNWLPLNA